MSQQVVAWLCAFPRDECASQRKKIVYFTFALGVVVASVFSVAASTVFIYRNVSTNLEETLFSLFHNIGAWVTLYQSVAMILLRHNFMVIFDGLAKIYNKSEHKFRESFI